MTRVYIHPLAGVLSAYGMGLAQVRALREEAVERRLEDAHGRARGADATGSATQCARELEAQGGVVERIEKRVHLKYEGTDTVARGAARRRRRRCARTSSGSTARASASSCPTARSSRRRCRWRRWASPTRRRKPARADATGARRPRGRSSTRTMTSGGARHRTPVFRPRRPRARAADRRGRRSSPSTTPPPSSSPAGRREVTALDHLVLERVVPREARYAAGTHADPVMLEVFNNLFMSIAEQMGVRLAQTAYSVNIKERLDFSCALFDAEGNLIANAPAHARAPGLHGRVDQDGDREERREDEARRRLRAERSVQRRHAPAGRDGDHAGVRGGTHRTLSTGSAASGESATSFSTSAPAATTPTSAASPPAPCRRSRRRSRRRACSSTT